MSDINTYLQQAIDISEDKTLSAFQQREEFRRFLQGVIDESRDKLLMEIATRRKSEDLENLRYTPPI